MMFYFGLLLLLQVIVAAPLPRVITRMHTAEAVTSTQTYYTGTTTVWLPPVQILVSNGVTYTSTLTEGQWATTQATYITTISSTEAAGQPQPTETEDESAPTTASPTTTEIVVSAENKEQTTESATTPTTTSTAAPTTSTPAQGVSTGFVTKTSLSTIVYTPSNTQNQETQNETQDQETQQTQTTAQTTQTTKATTQANNQVTTQTTQTTGQTTTTKAASAATSAASGKVSPPSAIVYSPYADDGSCKSYNAISSDLQLIKSKGINKLRIYGTDCLLFDAILPLCKQMGFTVNQGFWISSAGVNSIDDGVSSLIDWAQTNGWDIFDFFTVGNEAVIAGYCSVSDLISKISSVKSKLKNAGWSGKVTTSEPPVTYIDNPELCTDSAIDFVGINPHSYFNTNLYAYQAGEYIASQRDQVADVCSKSVFITETGYPHKGDTYGNNVPSPENQLLAIQSIMQYTGGDVTILTTYDDMWKDPGPHNIEQYFGTIDIIQ